MKLAILLLLCSTLIIGSLGAQSVGVGTTTPNASAMLDVSSPNKGMLVPRVSLTSLADAATIATPATSLLVYNTNALLIGGAGFYYNGGTAAVPAWIKILTNTSAGWSLTGNAGTDPAINFIGTTDNKPLRFRMANVPSGFIDYNTRSTFFGAEAGQNHTFASNSSSTGFGYQVMTVHTGALNTAVGAFALSNNQQFGYYNSAIGYEALFSNTTGQRNVAVGQTSLRSNTTGGINTAVGDSAMAFNTTGSNNTAIGAYTLKQNSTASNNVALGYYALENSTAGNNTALGVSSMRDNSSGSLNTAVGASSLRHNLTGVRNAAVGYGAMEDNTSGESNAALGYHTLASNTTGDFNTALGYIALTSNTSGNNNVAIGSNALASNTFGDNNTVVGVNALGNSKNSFRNVAIGNGALATQSYQNEGTGWAGDNVAVGYNALFSNQPNATSNLNPLNGVRNIAIGSYSLTSNTTGLNNSAIGYESLHNNTTGYWNNAIGVQSMYFNTTGNSNVSVGNNNLKSNTNGENNVSLGIATMFNNTTGYDNAALGTGALNANTTGFFNTAVGSGAGSFNNANTYCTFVGYDADQSTGSNYQGSMALGYNARITANSQVRIGNTATASIGGYQPWSDISDGRFKKNISEQVKGVEFIMALRPVTYNLDVNGLSGYLKEDTYKDKSGKTLKRAPDAAIIKQRNERSLMVHTGFIAQEVEAAAKKINYDFSGIDAPKNPDDLYALRYSEFVVPLTKAVQEQQAEIIDLKARILKLEVLLNKLVPQPGK